MAIGLAREQRLELAARDVGLEPAQRLLGLGDDLGVLLGLAELDHGELVVELLLDAADGGELVLERGALLHHALGALLVVPEIGVFGLLVQLGEAPRALSKSKMPPQQPDRLLDVIDDGLGFRAHGMSIQLT